MKPHGASMPTRVSGAARVDPAELDGGGRERDHAMAAMVAVALVVGEDHAEIGVRADRVGEDAGIHVGMAARLEHQRAAQMVGIAPSARRAGRRSGPLAARGKPLVTMRNGSPPVCISTVVMRRSMDMPNR